MDSALNDSNRSLHGSPPSTAIDEQSPAEASSPPAEDDRHSEPADALQEQPFYSMNNLTTPEEEEPSVASNASSDTFLYAWLVCTVMASSLTLPLGLLIIHFMSATSSRQEAFLNNSALTSFQSSLSTAQSPSSTTEDITEGLPAHCTATTVINDTRRVVNTAVARTSTNIQQTDILFCCLYNNSRFHKPQQYDYLPLHVPMDLCPCLVYWSMGIDAGRVVSRVPAFDAKYGLNALTKLRKYNSKLLMTVGGYREDSTQFSMLGRVTGLMSRFAADVIDFIRINDLDGVNIHWDFPGDECGHAQDHDALLNLLDKLRAIFNINSPPGTRYYITAMFSDDWTLVRRYYNLPLLYPHLDYFFFNTNDPDFDAACMGKRPPTTIPFNMLSDDSKVPPKIRDKACFSASLLFGANHHGAVSPHPTMPISQLEDRAASFEFCNDHSLTVVLTASCLLYSGYTVNFYTEATDSYVDKFRKFKCFVAYDVDFDDYKGECKKNFEQDFGLRRLWEAIGKVTI